MSIHKSQGMSIDCLIADLTGAFADGHGYFGMIRDRALTLTLTLTLTLIEGLGKRYSSIEDISPLRSDGLTLTLNLTLI